MMRFTVLTSPKSSSSVSVPTCIGPTCGVVEPWLIYCTSLLDYLNVGRLSVFVLRLLYYFVG